MVQIKLLSPLSRLNRSHLYPLRLISFVSFNLYPLTCILCSVNHELRVPRRYCSHSVYAPWLSTLLFFFFLTHHSPLPSPHLTTSDHSWILSSGVPHHIAIIVTPAIALYFFLPTKLSGALGGTLTFFVPQPSIVPSIPRWCPGLACWMLTAGLPTFLILCLLSLLESISSTWICHP